MKQVFVLVVAALAAPAVGQVAPSPPDRLCGALTLLVGKTGAAPFRDFEIDARTGKPLANIVRPAGLEGAYDCQINHTAAAEAYQCVFTTPQVGVPAGTMSIGDRVKACLAPASAAWTPAPISGETEGVVGHRFVNAKARREIIALTAGAGTQMLRETVTVFAIKPK